MSPTICNTSLFIPYPVSIYVTANTFVRYNDDRNGGSDSIGMILKIYSPEEERVQIHCFLSWAQLVQHIGPERIGNLSFWRHSSCGSEDMDDVSISTDEGDAWPLHSDTEIHGSKLSGIDISNQQVITENLSINSIDVVINIINDMLQ